MVDTLVSARPARVDHPGYTMNANGTHVSLREEILDATTLIVEAEGEVDLYAAPELKRIVWGAIDAGHTHVVVDLTHAAFMDSAALGALIGAVKRLRVRDGTLVVASSQPSILRILEITGLDQVVAVYASREEAIAAVQRRTAH
jgi:anti-sigma B factor antagonist